MTKGETQPGFIQGSEVRDSGAEGYVSDCGDFCSGERAGKEGEVVRGGGGVGESEGR